MCLPDFIEFKQINENEPLIGYRTWRNQINPKSLELRSEYMNYIWKPIEGLHEITRINSGIYAYNYNHYNYYNNNYDYHYNDNYNDYNDNHNYYYYHNGIIKQWGKIAIHRNGQRSEFAKIDKLFTIRELDAKGPAGFTNWMKKFNELTREIANKYNAETIHWQDFTELQK